MKCIHNEIERSDTDLHSTCLNHESKWSTPCVSIQGIQANRVCGAWLKTLEIRQKKHCKAGLNHQSHTSKMHICKTFPPIDRCV